MKDEFITVPAYVLKLHDPGFFWIVLLDIAHNRNVSQNEAFEILSGIFEEYYHCRKYTDVRSARRAAFSKRSNMLPITGTDQSKFKSKLKIMTDQEIEKLIFDENADGFEMTAEIAAYLGLSEQWKAYEAAKQAPPRQMTREELDGITEQQNEVERLKYPDYKPGLTRAQWEALKIGCEDSPND